jgi:hypothetical protein
MLSPARSRLRAIAWCLLIVMMDVCAVPYLETVRHVHHVAPWHYIAQALLQAVPAHMYRPTSWPFVARWLVMATASAVALIEFWSLG